MRDLWKLISFGLVGFLLFPASVSANGLCPEIGQSPSCSVLVTIQTDGSLKVDIDSSVPPYDGVEDILVGVSNQSGATVFGVTLVGNGAFMFDADGPFGGGAYFDNSTTFAAINANKGVVNFAKGLDDGQFTWFALEGQPSVFKQSPRVMIDPGHGTDCAKIKQNVGAISSISYPASNPPPGQLYEDVLTVQTGLALQQSLTQASYTAFMTKTDVTSCPSFIDRIAMANRNKVNGFVSIHYDKATLFGFHGSLGIYNSEKASAATLAQNLADNTSLALGLSNRGIKVDNSLAVLKKTLSNGTNGTRMSAAIIEVGRLSYPDANIIHTPGSDALAAKGIQNGLNAYFNFP